MATGETGHTRMSAAARGMRAPAPRRFDEPPPRCLWRGTGQRLNGLAAPAHTDVSHTDRSTDGGQCPGDRKAGRIPLAHREHQVNGGTGGARTHRRSDTRPRK